MSSASVISCNSHGSSGSVASAGSRGKSRYRTVNKNSSIDESLFGKPRTSSAPQDRKSLSPKDDSRSYSAPKKAKEPEVIQVITKDMIRKLRIPRDDPSGQTLIVSDGHFGRIRNAARVLTKKEREALQDQMKEDKKDLQDAAMERKDFMQQMELKRKQNEKLSDLEQEAKEKSQYLLQKAQEQMEEQEDEIKKLNETILNAKCHAIRDAQLIEKTEIKKEILEEDKRLDEMMENDRIYALREYEERDNAKRLERLKGAQVLHQQIEENEQHNLLEQEKKDQETKAMLQYLEKLKKEDMDALVKKKNYQKAVMEDVARSNQEIQEIKEQQKSREALEESKVMEYLKEKAIREEAFEKEKEKLSFEREKEIARLRAQQERAKDKQAEKNALRAKRNQEEAEREWRRKEREDAMKKAQMEKSLRDARQEQVANKGHFLAVQAARDRAEFERVLNAQQEQVYKDEEAEIEFQNKRTSYAEDVRTQIKSKEKERVQARQAFFEEGIKLDQEAKERRMKLDEIKRRKLKELKEVGVSEKYVNEVARRIEAPPPSLSNML